MCHRGLHLMHPVALDIWECPRTLQKVLFPQQGAVDVRTVPFTMSVRWVELCTRLVVSMACKCQTVGVCPTCSCNSLTPYCCRQKPAENPAVWAEAQHQLRDATT